MENEYFLTTIDNPFNPFTQFNDWYNFDTTHGYHSLSYLARIAHVSDDLTPFEETREIQNAIDEIVRLNINGMYSKIYKNNEPVPSRTKQT